MFGIDVPVMLWYMDNTIYNEYIGVHFPPNMGRGSFMCDASPAPVCKLG